MTPLPNRLHQYKVLLGELARQECEAKGLGYLMYERKEGTPASPGVVATHPEYLAVGSDGKGPVRIPLTGPRLAQMRQMEEWVKTGEGPSPAGAKIAPGLPEPDAKAARRASK